MPSKIKEFTKEEKKEYKELVNNFSNVINLYNVVEAKVLKEKLPDLTLNELHLIEVINKNHLAPMTEIAEKMEITVGAMITCLNRLINKDYVERIVNEKDKRIVKLTTTDKGKAILKVHDKYLQQMMEALLTRTSLDNLLMVFSTINNEMEKRKEELKSRK